MWWNRVDVELGGVAVGPSSLFATSSGRGDLGADLDIVTTDLDPSGGRLASALAELPLELRPLPPEPTGLIDRGRSLVDHLQEDHR